MAVEVAPRSGNGGELVVVVGGGKRIEVRPGFDIETFRRLILELERA